jgi:hypothetical protein
MCTCQYEYSKRRMCTQLPAHDHRNLNCQGQSLRKRLSVWKQYPRSSLSAEVTIPGVNDLGAVDGGVFKNNLKSVVCVGV